LGEDNQRLATKRLLVTIKCVNIELSEKQLNDWKTSFAKSGIVYDNDDDYREAIYNLVGYFDLLIKMDIQQKANN
jgi:hypothetical protein